MTARVAVWQYASLGYDASELAGVVHKHLRATLDGLDCNNKNFVSNNHKFLIAKFPDVGVKESTNKMVPHEPFHLALLSLP